MFMVKILVTFLSAIKPDKKSDYPDRILAWQKFNKNTGMSRVVKFGASVVTNNLIKFPWMNKKIQNFLGL